MYLLRASTKHFVYPYIKNGEELSMCVQNCGDYAYNYVNNDNTMQCEYCGEGCQLCSP